MYDLHLSSEQLEMRDTVRDFVEREIKPISLNSARLEQFEKPLLTDLLDQVSQLGLRAIALSEEAGGAAADVFYVDDQLMTAFAPTGQIVPLDDYMAEYGTGRDDFIPALLSIFTLDGQTYALPKDWGTLGLVYLPEAFAAAGIDEPTADWGWDDLKTAAEAIAATGESSVDVDIRSRDEIGQLARNFNRMASDLHRQRERLIDEVQRREEQETRQRLLAAENERKSRELEEARQFQLSLLPEHLPRHPDWEIAVFMKRRPRWVVTTMTSSREPAAP